MKTLKYLFSLILLTVVIIACSDDDELTNVDVIAPPTNVSAAVTVTQDNSGLVTITPLGEGVVDFVVNFGDGSEISEAIQPGDFVEHTYEEGSYEIAVTANGLNDLSTVVNQQIVVSFQAPQNLEVVIENDASISKQVNIVVTADFAMYYEVDFGEGLGTEPTEANIGDLISYQYTDPGTYTITVVAKGAAIETTTYTEEFEVTEITAPIVAAPMPPARAEIDVVSIYSDAYTNIDLSEINPDWQQTTVLAELPIEGNNAWYYSTLNYTGIVTSYDTPTDLSAMEYVHFDYWTHNGVSLGLKLVNTTVGSEDIQFVDSVTLGEWVSVDIPLSDFDISDISQISQILFDTDGSTADVFIDNLYFWKEPSVQNTLVGSWKFADEGGALGVGPNIGDVSWWNCDAACVIDRACFYDDEFVFGADGSFMNILGTDTWVEGWQGGGDSCGAPVAPHDGSTSATYTYDAAGGKVTINGVGAYIGLPKANNQGELPNVAVPDAITYDVVFLDENTISVTINVDPNGGGVYWQYKLVREGGVPSPLTGTWVMASEAGALGVGPAVGDVSWWNCDAGCVVDRACYYDDQYVFGADGSFTNVLGADSWIEGWQGGGDACGTPVAPHDGSGSATYTYDAGAGTVSLNGAGAFLGLAKANNQGELPNVAVPDSITYELTFIDNNTISVVINVDPNGAGIFWQFKLVKI